MEHSNLFHSGGNPFVEFSDNVYDTLGISFINRFYLLKQKLIHNYDTENCDGNL